MQMSSQSSSNQGGNFPLDNLTYDVITLLYEKSKGLEAYQKYLKDAQNNQEVKQLLQQLMDQDQQAVQQLQQHLGRLLSQQGGQQSSAGSAATSGGGKQGPTS
jgi:hypothetical protein